MSEAAVRLSDPDLASDYEPFESAGLANPYPVYAALREMGPVVQTPRSGMYCVTRWDEVQFVLKNTELFSSEEMARLLMNGQFETMPFWKSIPFLLRFLLRTRLNPIGAARARNLVALDPPRHDALRATVNRGFTPGQIGGWEARVREVTDACLKKLDEGGTFDVVAGLASPLPSTIIAEMIGVESGRRDDFRAWTDTIIRMISGSDRSAMLRREYSEPVHALILYLRGIIRERSRDPRDDLISAILQQRDGEVGLNVHEVFQFIILLLIAGNETTTNLIANATLALLDRPELLEQVDRDATLVPRVLEETLRWDPPIQILFRSATRDLELAGTYIPKGSTVAPLLASANRDERQFARADEFDPFREETAHLGFGFGVHFCLGAALARLEGRVAMEGLVPRLRRRKLLTQPRLRESFLVRGPESVPLSPA